MPTPQRSPGSGPVPGRRRGGRLAARLGPGVLLASLGGCAFFHADAPANGLRQRILPPTEPLLTARETRPSDDPAVAPEELPRPRELPAPEHALEPTASPEGQEEGSNPCCLTSDAPALPQGPLTLDQAVALAFRLSPTLEVMRERIAQAEGGKQVAFADFLPEAGVSFRHIEGAPSSEPFGLPTMPTYVGNIAPGGPSDRFDRAELAVQWILWDFGRTAGKFGQAVDAVEVAKLQYRRACQTVAFNVAAAYFAVLQARAARRVAEEAERRAESVLRDARNFLKRGTAIRNDVLRAEVLLAETRLSLVKARTAEAAAIAGLNQAVGINVSFPTQVVDLPGEPAFGLTLAQCLQLAADHRDEFRVVLRTIRSARLGTGVAQADFLPKVTVGGVGLHQDARGQKDVDLASAGVGLELALFEGGRRVGRLRAAEAEARAAVARGKEVCDRIAYEVNVAYLGIDDARQRIALSRTAVAQAEENLRVVRGLAEKGDATPTDLVDAELAITRAQQNYWTALYDYQTALARLTYAVGVPIQRRKDEG